MGGMLVEGQWTVKHKWERGKDGAFRRQNSSFRDWVEDTPDARFTPEAGRYHLYVSLACPWANRVLIVRALLGLEEVLPVSTVHYLMLDDGWVFKPGEDDSGAATEDHLFGVNCLHELYTRADARFTGRVTVPVLWDTVEETIVNNESREIIEMLTTVFAPLANHKGVDLYPEPLREHIDEVIDAIYEPINNGVYRCGFAGSQAAYEAAFTSLFDALDHWDAVLGERPYLCGDQLTLADVCMVTTLVRFDAVYYVHFKCNKRLIDQYEHLSGYTRQLYQMPEIHKTINFEHITKHYYQSHTHINPTQMVPVGPVFTLDQPHHR